MPAFFIVSDADRVVRAGATRDGMARWGAPAAGLALAPGPGADADAHVLAGAIPLPALTAPVAAGFHEWFRLPPSGKAPCASCIRMHFP